MASINQLVSDIAHTLRQPNNEPLRRSIKSAIITTRNELIRRSYENHGYMDRAFMQRFKVTLEDVLDGDPINVDPDVYASMGVGLTPIKRTVQIVPRPVRLTNNLPFARVSSAGFSSNREIPFIKETSARFRSAVPGLCGMPAYDYINGYIYLFPAKGKTLDLSAIVIEGPFEHPNEIDLANAVTDEWSVMFDDNEYLLSEDMVGQIKEILYKRDILQTVRETNEIPNNIKV